MSEETKRVDIAAEVSQPVFEYTVSGITFAVRKMSWVSFQGLRDILAEVLKNIAVLRSGTNVADPNAFVVDFTQFLSSAPFSTIQLVISGSVDFEKYHLPALEDWDFDDVLGLFGEILSKHFSDNEKVHSFFAAVARLIQASPVKLQTTTVPDPPLTS